MIYELNLVSTVTKMVSNKKSIKNRSLYKCFIFVERKPLLYLTFDTEHKICLNIYKFPFKDL